jgi:hypothetical protein
LKRVLPFGTVGALSKAPRLDERAPERRTAKE